jgi:hypothetical protein
MIQFNLNLLCHQLRKIGFVYNKWFLMPPIYAKLQRKTINNIGTQPFTPLTFNFFICKSVNQAAFFV